MFRRFAVQIIGAILCVAIALSSVFYYNSLNSSVEEVISPSTDLYNDLINTQENNPNLTGANEYDPVADVTLGAPKVDSAPPQTEYNYADEIAKLPTLSSVKSQGYAITSKEFGEGMQLAVAATGGNYSKAYSEKKHNTDKIVTVAGEKGGTVSTTEKVQEDRPLLMPYFGYIIYTAKGKTQLLSSDGRVLMSSFSGFEPTYRTTLSGEPLFKLKDKYYFYYDKSSKDVFFDKIEANTYAGLSKTEPTAAKYFNYDYYLITAKYYNEANNRQVLMTDISIQSLEKSGMVEYRVNESNFKGLTIPAYSYGENKSDLYPFYSYEYAPDFSITKTLWGYMNAKGDVVIEPQFLSAYSFSDEGFAVVEDVNSHLCIIDKKGKVVYNPYIDPIYLPELGGGYARSIFYLPDTYGEESTGMFSFSEGYVRMWNKLVDTTLGTSLATYGVKNERKILVNASGKVMNYPADYDLVSYSNGMLLLEKNGKYGYMNTNGEWVIKPILEYAAPFSEGLAVIGYSANKLGVINSKGELVVPTMFSHIENCSGGVITAHSEENGWVILNKVTKEKEKDFTNPVLTLKYRALAKAKYDFYQKQQ